jgi:hypothetical protein
MTDNAVRGLAFGIMFGLVAWLVIVGVVLWWLR